MSKKTTAKKIEKTAAAKTETKAAKPPREKKVRAPRESREGWGTFALKMPVPEREAFHRAAGSARASLFARRVLVAFSNEDEAGFKAAIKEAREARQ